MPLRLQLLNGISIKKARLLITIDSTFFNCFIGIYLLWCRNTWLLISVHIMAGRAEREFNFYWPQWQRHEISCLYHLRGMVITWLYINLMQALRHLLGAGR